jgi:hypothetical protein
MKKTLLASGAAALLLLATAAAATAGATLDDVRAATAPFRNFDAAKAAGYDTKVIDVNGIACIDDPTGGMGIHYLNPGYLDADVDASKPELVIYEPLASGRMQLVAVEYLVLKSAWRDAHGRERPSLFGQQFELVKAGNRYGLPAFYELHAWVWQPNPLGTFNDWNPTVTCEHA